MTHNHEEKKSINRNRTRNERNNGISIQVPKAILNMLKKIMNPKWKNRTFQYKNKSNIY